MLIKAIFICFAVFTLSVKDEVSAAELPSTSRINVKSHIDKTSMQHVVYANGRPYRIAYNRRASRVEITSVGRKMVSAVPAAYDPALVGSDTLIGFLPEKLQVFKKNKVLLYVSSIRSSGGNGMGQCGSGSEIYLNFLDISTQVPGLKSTILIGSCKESIELEDQDVSKGEVGDITVVDNNLTLHFLNYKEIGGEPEAVVTPDYKLRFRGTEGD